MPHLAKTHRVIALDLPGFGRSDKPLDASYSLNFYTRLISQFFEQLEIKKTSLVLHDLGGPIGLHWSVRNPSRVASLAFLNTLVYANFSWAVVLFSLAIRMPLPKVARTMERIKSDLPQAKITPLPNCGHFLQEDEPQKLAELLSDFFQKS